jgi:hypothetical protein
MFIGYYAYNVHIFKSPHMTVARYNLLATATYGAIRCAIDALLHAPYRVGLFQSLMGQRKVILWGSYGHLFRSIARGTAGSGGTSPCPACLWFQCCYLMISTMFSGVLMKFSSSFFIKFCIFLFCLALGGCASPVEKIVSPASSPNASNGYLVGMFSTKQVTGFDYGFGFVNENTRKEYLFPFSVGRGSLLPLFMTPNDPRVVVDKIRMIEVPPGRYRIKYWAKFAAEFYTDFTKEELSNDNNISFEVQRGRATFVGRYTAANELFGQTARFSINPLSACKDDFLTRFAKEYPNIPLDSVNDSFIFRPC